MSRHIGKSPFFQNNITKKASSTTCLLARKKSVSWQFLAIMGTSILSTNHERYPIAPRSRPIESAIKSHRRCDQGPFATALSINGKPERKLSRTKKRQDVITFRKTRLYKKLAFFVYLRAKPTPTANTRFTGNTLSIFFSLGMPVPSTPPSYLTQRVKTSQSTLGDTSFALI